ncbi:hypothetical protein SAMN04488117_105208 [Celeribacter baekdonensis]|uniref:Uncharacterized protein n=1 Tax=Celeribacter baekdonensis TaxID=875171 RepID=A0A1G7MF57_9RHOB|nr:hypothetical protein SAMN04488117_105208 [Celeribacter baekdonensis]
MERGRQATFCGNERREKLDRSTITSNGEWFCVDGSRFAKKTTDPVPVLIDD